VVKVPLKGVHKAPSKGKTYWYAWRGGPRLSGQPGSPEFLASYQDAHADLRTPDTGRFRSLVYLYRAGPFQKLAATTRKNWAPWLDRIADHFGDLRIEQFDRPQKIRRLIVKWRNQYADTPRTADLALQVLSVILSFGVDAQGKLASNPCEGIKQIYSGNRREIIWTDADLDQLKRSCPEEIGWAVDLAVNTGLRLGDLLRLCWSHIGDYAIVMTTSKSKHTRQVVIPLHDDLRAVLASIPKRSTNVLTNSRRRTWTGNGFGTAFNRAKARAGMSDRDLHFHDLRGTAATRFYTADLKQREIAEIMGWEEEHVDRIIRRYVGRTAATNAVIEKLRAAKRRT
jgi:integrase